MKQSFDNVAAAHVQADTLSLPLAERLVKTQKIRTHFTGWMQEVFSLRAEQVDQLEEMPDELRDEIIYSRAQTSAYRADSTEFDSTDMVSIWIRYTIS